MAPRSDPAPSESASVADRSSPAAGFSAFAGVPRVPVPANDDAFKSINILTRHIGKVIEEALMERKRDKEDAAQKKEEDEKRRVDETVEEANS